MRQVSNFMKKYFVFFVIAWASAWADTSFKINLDPLSVQKIDVVKMPSSIEGDLHTAQGEMIVYWSIDKGYKAYVEAFKVKIQPGVEVIDFHASPVHSFTDPLSGEIKEGTEGAGKMRVHFKWAQSTTPPQNANMLLTYQACTKKHCLFPKTKKIPIQLEPKLAPLQAPVRVPKSWWASLQAHNIQDLMQQNWLLVFALVFLAGILTSLTPCVLPMIPITLAVLGARNNKSGFSKRKALAVSLVYVLGVATTYSALGVLAASTGALFGSFVSNPWLMGGVFLFFMAMGLSLLGVFDLQLPAKWTQKLQTLSVQGPVGIFLSGLVAGVVAGPCVGPVLAGVLVFVATSQNIGLGFALLFTFSMGLGVLFILLGVFQNMLGWLRQGLWMLWLKKALGVALMLTAVYLVWPVGSRVIAGARGTYYGVELPAQATISKKSALMAKAHGTKQQALPWKPYTEAALHAARQADRPVVIDIYAQWCVACFELEKLTFSQPGVLKLAPQFEWLKFDATNSSPELKKLTATYGIVGLPWVMFFDSTGQWHQDLTLTGFEKADKFISRLQKLQN